MSLLISVDIETSCNVEGCPGGSKCYNTLKHALHFKKNKIDKIGVYWNDKGNNEKYFVFNDILSFNDFILSMDSDVKLLGQNFKFDYKTLVEKGAAINLDMWEHDTYLMAVGALAKVPESFLEDYNKERMRLNKELKANVHRKVEGLSLKTLAPYFLEVEPFWEVQDKNNNEYVIKDAKYTYMLYKKLKTIMDHEGTYEFYKTKLLPWTKTLLQAETRGVLIDMKELDRLESKTKIEAAKLRNELDRVWSPHYRAHKRLQGRKLKTKYIDMFNTAIEKLGDKLTVIRYKKLKNKYYRSFITAYRKESDVINFDSPKQLAWLLGTRLGYNIMDEEKGKISTGKEVLRLLEIEGHTDIKLFQKYRGKSKLLSSFFPSYREKVVDGILYCTFDPGGTKTGRLSAREPNLQQVPKELHSIFIARPGYKLVTRDASAIEPNLIAYFSEDKFLCNILIGNEDFHGYVTVDMMDYVNCDPNEVKPLYKKERDCCKQFDLSIFYGSGANRMIFTGLKHEFKFTKDEAHKRIRQFKDKFKETFTFKQEIDKILVKNPLTNILGRKFRIVNQDDIYMTGFNRLVQGSASDLVLNSGHKIQTESNKNNMDCHLLLLVHDELVVEVPETKVDECVSLIEKSMTDYKLVTSHGQIKLKVEGTVGNHWEK